MVFVLQVGAVLAAGVFAALAWDSNRWRLARALVSGNRVCAFLHCLLEPPLAERDASDPSGSIAATPPEQARSRGQRAESATVLVRGVIRARIAHSRFYLLPNPHKRCRVPVVHVPAAAEHGDRQPQKAMAGLLRVTPAKSASRRGRSAPLRYATTTRSQRCGVRLMRANVADALFALAATRAERDRDLARALWEFVAAVGSRSSPASASSSRWDCISHAGVPFRCPPSWRFRHTFVPE